MGIYNGWRSLGRLLSWEDNIKRVEGMYGVISWDWIYVVQSRCH
jgi:hypothetical protein